MSECVVRMEMPQDCGECRFRSDGWCYGIREFDPQPGPLDFEKRPSWCPIICQLPEGHGRLIDAEKLKAKKYHSDKTHENAVAVAEIDWAKSIVPAERRET